MKDLVFWTRTARNINISLTLMLRTLEKHGIRRYFVSNNTMIKPIYVEVNSNKVRQINEGNMLELLIDIIEEHGDEFVKETFLRMRGILSLERLSHLPKLESSFLKDSNSYSYFFFRNIVCRVSRNDITLISYNDLNGLIWTSQIIDHNINLVAFDEVTRNLKFYEFLADVTAHKEVDSGERLEHLLTLIGYLLHRYKNPIFPKAVVLMDENLSDRPQGGTGKTLIAEAIGKVRKITMEDGKSFRPNERFAFQQVLPDTKIILFDDAHKHFDFERIFPAITSSLSVEKKNKDKYSIPFEDSPKVLVTTNYAISGIGASFRRRLYEFEISQRFNDIYTPFEAYGRPFFNGWTIKEWDMFYSLLMECCRLYLSEGVKLSTPINLIFKKLINQLPKQFVEFMQSNIKMEEEYNKNTVYEKFKNTFGGYLELTKNRFTRMLDTYVEILDLDLITKRSGKRSFFTIIPKIP